MTEELSSQFHEGKTETQKDEDFPTWLRVAGLKFQAK